jgi:hypothetical protein
MKRCIAFAVLGTILVAAVCFSALGSNDQQLPPGAWSTYRMVCNIEELWGEVSFALDLSDDKLLEMRPDFQKAWDTRDEITGGITAPEDVLPSIDKLGALGNELVSQVKKKLTDEQSAKLSMWVKLHNARLNMVQTSARSALAERSARQEKEE